MYYIADFKNVIPNLRGCLPFVYIMQKSDIAENLCPEKVVSFVTETIALIQENNISALIIDNIFVVFIVFYIKHLIYLFTINKQIRVCVKIIYKLLNKYSLITNI